jgi:translocation and assembly module TamB
MSDQPPPAPPAAPVDGDAAPPAPARVRRWPRRVAIGAALTAAFLGGAYWYLGRETTLQDIAARIARASGGSIEITGVRGSLYGSMHMGRIVYRSPEQVITADRVDVTWSPWQYLSKGVAVSRLHVATLRVDTLKDSEPPKMPASLAPPFTLDLRDARVGKLILARQGSLTELSDVRVDNLHGDRLQWTLKGAHADTPWGIVKGEGRIAASRPFALNASASLTQSVVQLPPPRTGEDGKPVPAPPAVPASLNVRANGDLANTIIDADGQAGRAQGSARLVLAPFEAIPLRSFALDAKNINPGFFGPTLPDADLTLAVRAALDPQRRVSGHVDLSNLGPAGPLDQDRLPLRAVRGRLAGDLSKVAIENVLIDFGAAGRFTGAGSIAQPLGSRIGAGPSGQAPGQAAEGAPLPPASQPALATALPNATFHLRTERLDLRAIHGRLKRTTIAGDLELANRGARQLLAVRLADAGLRLDADAALENQVVTIQQATLAAGPSRLRLHGQAALTGEQPFDVKAEAVRLNPAAFGDYPTADINANVNARGTLKPGWRVAADFALRPSRLFGQPLSGKGSLQADARHVSKVDAALALGRNSATVRGAFGAPGERLHWRVEGRDLALLRSDLYGAITASGVVTGSMAEPRTTFTAEARGLGWAKGQRDLAAQGVIKASGEAWLAPAGKDKRILAARGQGTLSGVNPLAFGAPITASINGRFSGSGRAGPAWQANASLDLAQSTLGTAPLSGHARLTADARRVSNASIDLRAGPNTVTATGGFGTLTDRLDWRVDAPQLAALGAGFGGTVRGSGTLKGTLEAPALSASVDGQNLRTPGLQQLKSLRASVDLGSGKGASDPLAADVGVAGLVAGTLQVDSARLYSSGTRGAHTLRLSARNPAFDTSGEVRGGWSGSSWRGTIAALQNRGRYAFALQGPVPVEITAPPGSGVAGLLKPAALSINNAVIGLPNGSVTVKSLTKQGPRWTSSGAATGVPLLYLVQASDALGAALRGDLTLGGEWSLDLNAAPGATPAVNGSVHLFREKGDLVAGVEIPVVLGLKTLDLRAGVSGGTLRVQALVDGTRAGRTQAEATVGLVNGRVDEASTLRMTASADMGSIAWLAPLTALPAFELGGALKVAINGAGTIGNPSLNGSINGDNLAVRWVEQGVRLRNGVLRAELTGEQLVLQRLTLEGLQGRAEATGAVRFGGGEAAMNLRLNANGLEVLSRPDRTVVVTGQAALVRDARRFTLEGKIRADRALIELAPQDRPTLSDDIVVLGRGTGPAAKSQREGVPLTADLDADLGNNFRLRGMGLDASLTGALRMRYVAGKAPRINGTIRAQNGTYRAYGQNLTIERGILTFSGPYDNPSLNILAVRKRPEGEQLSETNVEAGVQVRGTALAPQAKLVSTPNVSESEKLSWLVLGHGLDGTSGADASLLSAAAGALLGGKGGGLQSRVATSLGLDELGLTQAKGLESTVLTVGKRISSRTYLSFERGATSASTLVRLRYRLNPRVTLQFQTGANTALDVLYSWAWD